MKTPQLMVIALLAVAAAGCTRGETDEAARRTAGELRDAASVASDRLADGWLATKIQAQYFADEDVKARFINVSADDGVVTLRGRVDSGEAREQAVQIAGNTDGVREVKDLLIVGPSATAADQRDAAWITTQIQARYFADSQIAGREIDVNTADGVVTLTGRVGTPQEKEEAASIARSVAGVRRVDDRLVVQDADAAAAVATAGTTAPGAAAAPPVDDRRLTTSIQAKYFLDNMLKSRKVEVVTQQGVVTLRGEVGSDNERAQALLLAQTTEGVSRVEDHLTVNAALAPVGTTGTAATAPETAAAQAQDDALVESVKTRLAADRQARAATIEISAKDGVVLLDGTAPNAAAKQRAVAVARQTQGVVQVVDRIRVGRAR